MSSEKRRFQRPLGERSYRKLFVIATEGIKTEPQYFNMFNNRFIICVKCLKDSHNNSSPAHVLKRMNEYLRQNGLKSSDEAWLVVDKNSWTDKQLTELFIWSQTRNNYGFAVSNPKFEYWLLLHFEDGAGITSSQNCTERLKRYIPNYDKSIDIRKITYEQIHEAVRRAKLRDNPSCAGWSRPFGSTTVYKLVENLLMGSAQ